MIGSFVGPKTFLVGFTTAHMEGLEAYLEDTGQTEFLELWHAAKAEGLHDGECMASFYAKLCYSSLVEGKNANLTKTRDIPSNLDGVIVAGHSSVWGHASVNLVTTRCSRILTHELVRNHVGTEFSQTSGRYVRLDKIDLVLDPILDDCRDLLFDGVGNTEILVYVLECRKGLRIPPFDLVPEVLPFNFTLLPLGRGHYEELLAKIRDSLPPDVQAFSPASPALVQALRWVPNNKLPFDFKKKVTSAIRRIAPNGQSNEIGWTINLRALRHVIQMRTGRHAEWEIRLVFSQVYDLISAKFPQIFCDARTEVVDGLVEVSGMRTQPYQLSIEQALEQASVEQLKASLAAHGG